ncbi:MAG: signal peptide peptidase SppA [Bacteroidia bacterium]
MLATIAGIFISCILFILVLIGIIAAVAAGSGGKEVTVKKNSVLELKLNYMIPERTSANPFSNFDFASFEGNKNAGLNDILKCIRSASKDENIKGIYLNVSVSPNNYGTLEEIRDALIEFKKSKKFIIAYGEVMEEHSYYLASVADKIYLNPAGELLLNGFNYQEPYLKNMFDKIGVEPELIRHGKYKAAGEPLIADKMSDENRKQIETYVGGMYKHFIAKIAESRKKSYDEVFNIANKLLIQCPDDAKKLGMIDSVCYEDNVTDELKRLLSIKESEKINFIGCSTYSHNAKDNSTLTSKNKIAVIYIEGDIVSGDGEDDKSAGSKKIAESISKCRKDSTVKAIVLRINSPGGSALASDVMWREIELAKKSKPVIASFGAVAASGGYYVGAPANVIVAEPNTITGSIGVFGLLINAQKLLNDKLGINFQTVKFGEYSDLGTLDRPMTVAEKEIVQRAIDKVYNDFVSKVADGRKLKKEFVDSIAQGRVWTGEDGMKIGLVDSIGGLDKAIAIAVQRAKLKDYRISNYPEPKEFFENILKTLTDDVSLYFTKKQLGEDFKYYEQLRKATQMKGIQARMLWDAEIK